MGKVLVLIKKDSTVRSHMARTPSPNTNQKQTSHEQMKKELTVLTVINIWDFIVENF